MTTPPFIDAHHHLWVRDGGYPWLASAEPALNRDYRPVDYLADLQDAVPIATVHIEAAHDPRTPVHETTWLESVAMPRLPAAIVAYARLQDPDLETVLAHHLSASSRVRGVRQMLDWDGERQGPTTLMDDPRWQDGLDLLAASNLSFDLQVVPSQLSRAADLASQHRQATFVLNHAGYNVPASRRHTEEWRDGIAAVAEVPNIVVKLSGFPAIRGAADAPDAAEFFAGTLERVGWHRVMFATNFPHDARFVSLLELVALVDAELPPGNPPERAAFFHQNAQRVYRITSDDD